MSVRSAAVALLTVLAVLRLSTAGAQQAAVLPPGEGREIVATACTQCHNTGPFVQLRAGVDAWRSQIYDMILRGAQLRPSEIEPAARYLANNFGPGVNLTPPTVPVSLPQGAQRELVQERCVLCHGLDRVVAARRTPAEWQAIVARMAFLGTPMSAEEGKRIGAYLQQNFSPL
jgi:mono/diheme cytochrome c family protein